MLQMCWRGQQSDLFQNKERCVAVSFCAGLVMPLLHEFSLFTKRWCQGQAAALQVTLVSEWHSLPNSLDTPSPSHALTDEVQEYSAL